jgi:hypothetical protein
LRASALRQLRRPMALCTSRTLSGLLVFDAAAGTLCDFEYHEEATVSRNSRRWFDSADKICEGGRQ